MCWKGVSLGRAAPTRRVRLPNSPESLRPKEMGSELFTSCGIQHCCTHPLGNTATAEVNRVNIIRKPVGDFLLLDPAVMDSADGKGACGLP